MTIDPAVVIAAIGSLAGLLLAAIRDLRQDRDFWRTAALKSIGNTDQTLEVAKKVTDA